MISDIILTQWLVSWLIRKKEILGWSFYEVIFGTYIEVTLTFLFCDLAPFCIDCTQIIVLVCS
jgi:acid phosphatase family membrane protein YuiD